MIRKLHKIYKTAHHKNAVLYRFKLPYEGTDIREADVGRVARTTGLRMPRLKTSSQHVLML